ncbi:TIGR00270 family protein, partial [Candidatus Woesearchaeota archaeon]|nr:TIGR00270 family protein [Candidatus Woesearchaeota archaeon]
VRVEKEWKVVADFSQLLRSAREKRNLSQQDFAVFLQEKESVVKKWEAGSVKPSLESAQKLERVLGTSLVIEDDSLVSSSLPSRKSDELTLGDVMNVKK